MKKMICSFILNTFIWLHCKLFMGGFGRSPHSRRLGHYTELYGAAAASASLKLAGSRLLLPLPTQRTSNMSPLAVSSDDEH